MRVESATLSSFMTRRSMARAMTLMMTMKAVTTTSPLSSDHSENCALPGSRSMLSSARSMASNQPTTWKAIASQTISVMRDSQACTQDCGPTMRPTR